MSLFSDLTTTYMNIKSSVLLAVLCVISIMITPVMANYDADGFDENGFNSDGIHRDSAELCDVDGFDASVVGINEDKEGYFSLSHLVTRESYFKLLIATSRIEKAGSTKIGRLIIRNNTRDGYNLAAISSNGGTLSSVTNSDGEDDIPYSLKFSLNGNLGEGVNRDLDIASETLMSPVNILSKAGNTISSPTDIELVASVYINDDSNIMSMAGTYTDTLIIEYTDL